MLSCDFEGARDVLLLLGWMEMNENNWIRQLHGGARVLNIKIDARTANDI